MVEPSKLQQAVEELQVKRGSPEAWRDMTKVLLDHVKNNPNSERLLCLGEHRTSTKHEPAILVYNTNRDKIQVLISNSANDGVTHGREDCFYNTMLPPMRTILEMDNEDATVVAGFLPKGGNDVERVG